jgi:transcription initiation factor IIF auxiliary subunit
LNTGKDKVRIKEITYILDESFPNPERKTMDRKNDFEIKIWSWGESVIKVIITTIDRNEYTKYFNFKFEDELLMKLRILTILSKTTGLAAGLIEGERTGTPDEANRCSLK